MALMKMQVLFSDEHRKVSGLWVSVLQGKDSLLKSDWCVISTDGEYRDFQPVCFWDSAVFHLEKESHIQPNNFFLLPCWSLILAFKLNNSYLGIKI